MHLATTLLLSTLPALHFASAHNPTTGSLHHRPRALLDVCAYLDVDLLPDASILGLSIGGLVHIDVCLCLSALPLYLSTTTNIELVALIDVLGIDRVTALLKSLVRPS
jgi:hypothetical protein